MQNLSIKDIFKDLDNRDAFVFLETGRNTSKDHRSYIFTEPTCIVSCSDADKVKYSFDAVDRMLEKGFHAAGFVSYEAGFAFEEALQNSYKDNFPLLWFGIFKKPVVIDHNKVLFEDYKTHKGYSLGNPRLGISEKEYTSAVDKIKQYIEQGDTYQINYTFKIDFPFSGSAFDLYADLRAKQSVSYSGIIKFDKKYIISFSPELFFRKEGGSIQVKPMKGTAGRGRYPKEDLRNENGLNLCPKNRSENIMIVDLLRNDLGKIAKKNSIKTKDLFEVERYESLFQMVSTVEGKIGPRLSLYDLFKAIFPSGSVTGAPKISSMKIIGKLEKTPRRVYTGSIGFIEPKGKSVFNVAIRTLLIDTKKGKGEMGIGSGIVYDSEPKKEYEECKLKAQFLTSEFIDFELIETLCWKPRGGYWLLKLHLERLYESARYFNFAFDKGQIKRALHNEDLRFTKSSSYRTRLLLNKSGRLNLASIMLESSEHEQAITFSDKRVSSSNPFLFHKTTNRNIYDCEWKMCKKSGFFDIIFQNEKGQITEGAISNIFIKKYNKYYTPPIECGLLSGVYRRHMLKSKAFKVEEKILYRDDIKNADEIILTNAVRGITKVRLLEKRATAHA